MKPLLATSPLRAPSTTCTLRGTRGLPPVHEADESDSGATHARLFVRIEGCSALRLHCDGPSYQHGIETVNPYIIARVDDGEWHKTAVREHCSAPAWNTEMIFSHEGLSRESIITLECWHYDESRPADLLLGQVDIPLDRIPQVELASRRYNLEPAGAGAANLVLFWEALGALKPVVSSLAHRRLRQPKPAVGGGGGGSLFAASVSSSLSRSPPAAGAGRGLKAVSETDFERVEAYEASLERAGRGRPRFPGLAGPYELTPSLRVTRVHFDGRDTHCDLECAALEASGGDLIGLRRGARGDAAAWREWHPFRDCDAVVAGAGRGWFEVTGDARGLLAQGAQLRLTLPSARTTPGPGGGAEVPEPLVGVVRDVWYLKSEGRSTVALEAAGCVYRLGALVERLFLVERGDNSALRREAREADQACALPGPSFRQAKGEGGSLAEEENGCIELSETAFRIDKLCGEDCFKVAGDATEWLVPGHRIAASPTGRHVLVKEVMLMRRETFVRTDRKHQAQAGDNIQLVRWHVDPSFVHSGLVVVRGTQGNPAVCVKGDATLLIRPGDCMQVARLPARPG